MNKVLLMGRCTKDPELRVSEVGGNNNNFCRWSLAVDRPWVKDRESQQTADFINCVAFGKTADFVDKWFKKGTPMVVVGRIQTGSYTNRDGVKVYTTDVMVENVEFVPKNNGNEGDTGSSSSSGSSNYGARDKTEKRRDDDFINIPDSVDEELPFN